MPERVPRAISICALVFISLSSILFSAESDSASNALVEKGGKIKTDKDGAVTEVNLAEANVTEADLNIFIRPLFLGFPGIFRIPLTTYKKMILLFWAKFDPKYIEKP